MDKAEKEVAKAAEKAEKEAPAAKVKAFTVLDANGKPRTVKTEEEAKELAKVLRGRIVR